jgi:chaperonin GroES
MTDETIQEQPKYKKIAFGELVKAQNIAELLEADQLQEIGQDVLDGYMIDKASRNQWEQRNAEAMKLALQVMESKSFPWVNASNVKFPLVTIAALQFLARVSILTKGRQLVKCDILGEDKDGRKLAKARRIATHMNYQLVEEDVDWIDDDEKAKLSASIVGCAFKKSYFDPVEGINISEFVSASNLIVDYWTKSLRKANRITQVLPLTENDCYEKYRAGLFCKVEGRQNMPLVVSVMSAAKDDASGVRRPANDSAAPFECLEQHNWMDLDGDGYKEPYVTTVKSDNGQVLRIVARFFDVGDVHRVNDAAVRAYNEIADGLPSDTAEAVSGKRDYRLKASELQNAKNNHIIRIDPLQYFSKIPFIPAPDGSFYDLGFGVFLGPINESVNSVINQLIDAATVCLTAGGFLGRGVKLKSGKTSFDPFEWKPVDSTGDDLRKNIFPLPVREPSGTMFQLLELLITYSEKISGATDIMSGISPGQNTPAETSRNTIEQGMKIFSGIYNRMYRAFRTELKLLYNLNRLYLPQSPHYQGLIEGDSALIVKDDYMALPVRIYPAADPAVVSEEQRKQKAMIVYGMAKEDPHMNRYEAAKRVLEANDISGIDELYPDPKSQDAVQPAPNPKIALEQQALQLKQQQQQMDWEETKARLTQDGALVQAKIAELSAKAEKELADANGIATGHQIALLNAQIGAAKAEQDGIVQSLKILHSFSEHMHERNVDSATLAMAKEKLSGNNKQGMAGVGAPSTD